MRHNAADTHRACFTQQVVACHPVRPHHARCCCRLHHVPVLRRRGRRAGSGPGWSLSPRDSAMRRTGPKRWRYDGLYVPHTSCLCGQVLSGSDPCAASLSTQLLLTCRALMWCWRDATWKGLATTLPGILHAQRRRGFAGRLPAARSPTWHVPGRCQRVTRDAYACPWMLRFACCCGFACDRQRLPAHCQVAAGQHNGDWACAPVPFVDVGGGVGLCFSLFL